MASVRLLAAGWAAADVDMQAGLGGVREEDAASPRLTALSKFSFISSGEEVLADGADMSGLIEIILESICQEACFTNFRMTHLDSTLKIQPSEMFS